uniref:Uncharacterized protein n=1 Tax=Anguilla anguilla TaxID=7936 RepID=A0A0E9QAD3_ANGAN
MVQSGKVFLLAWMVHSSMMKHSYSTFIGVIELCTLRDGRDGQEWTGSQVS